MKTIGRILAILFGSWLVLIGAVLIAGAIAVVSADQDADDFFVSDSNRLETDSFALTAEMDVLGDAPTWVVDWFTDVLDVRMTATSGAGGEVFMGIAATADVEDYLAGVAHDEVTGLDIDPLEVEYRSHEGTAKPAPPGEQTFWVASVEGSGEQTLDWVIEQGTWSAVLMNADADRGVSADTVSGVKIEGITTFMWIAFGLGAVVVIAGLALMIVGILPSRRPQSPPPAATGTTDDQKHVAGA